MYSIACDYDNEFVCETGGEYLVTDAFDWMLFSAALPSTTCAAITDGRVYTLVQKERPVGEATYAVSSWYPLWVDITGVQMTCVYVKKTSVYGTDYTETAPRNSSLDIIRITEELKIEKNATFKSRMRYMSIYDDRPSAQGGCSSAHSTNQAGMGYLWDDGVD
nr:hypothetical protein BaRGS_025421 [Batillaria attramentaria]